MAVILKQYSPEGELSDIGTVLYGGRAHLYAENARRELDRSIIIDCDQDDQVAEVYEVTDPFYLGVMNKIKDNVERLKWSRISAKKIASLAYGDELVVQMNDVDEGPYKVVIQNC